MAELEFKSRKLIRKVHRLQHDLMQAKMPLRKAEIQSQLDMLEAKILESPNVELKSVMEYFGILH